MPLLEFGALNYDGQPMRNVENTAFSNANLMFSNSDPLLGRNPVLGPRECHDNSPTQLRPPASRQFPLSTVETHCRVSRPQDAVERTHGTRELAHHQPRHRVAEKLDRSRPEESMSSTGLTRNHYDLLSQHRTNLLLEIQETEMMLNVYEQQKSESGRRNHEEALKRPDSECRKRPATDSTTGTAAIDARGKKTKVEAGND